MYSKVLSGAILGIDGMLITVEADVRDGLPCVNMVGVLASEVKEAKERVWAAMKNCGFRLPAKRITISLSPADIRKEGAVFDLPIAVAVLAATGHLLPEFLTSVFFVGELSLNGDLKPVNGILPLTCLAREKGMAVCVVPYENRMEGAMVEGIAVVGLHNLSEVVLYSNHPALFEEARADPVAVLQESRYQYEVDFAEIRGQELVKRAVEVAVAGMHNMLLIGPPGSGKSMIAGRIPTIMPDIGIEESLELTKIYSVSGLLKPGEALVTRRPYRSPHHTISSRALSGGGRIPQPGEISLAHKGVLFLDELPEFGKSVLEVLRQPMEEAQIQIARIHAAYTFPADFMLVAAMNPCPCGYYPDMNRCHCTPFQVRQYLGHISHPLLDRIDICVETAALSKEELIREKKEESSEAVRARVSRANEKQRQRYEGLPIRFNSQLSVSQLDQFCGLKVAEKKLLARAYEQLHLTTRAYQRIRKVARTIADLENSDRIHEEHIAEAIAYRNADLKFWS